jgi:hypothetical protein
MNVFRIVRVVFGVVGIGLLVASVVAVGHTRSFLADAVSAPGVVEGLVPRTSTDRDNRTSTTYAPQVRFTTAAGESVTFVSGSSSSPPAYQVGDTVEVLYVAADPRRARVHDWFSLWGLPTILGGLGAVFAAIGGSLAVAALRGRRIGPRPVAGMAVRTPRRAAPDEEPDEEPDAEADAELRRHGVRVHADVQHVRPTGAVADNGSGVYRIVAQWLDPDRHEVRVFTSHDIPYDPTPYLAGRTVDVYIAPDDPSRHLVDISFLPGVAR